MKVEWGVRIAAIMTIWMAIVSMVPAAESNAPAFRYGGDIRARQEAYDHIPPALSENDYIRFRTRLWCEYDPAGDVTINLRLANEFRHYFTPDQKGRPQTSSYEFTDEMVIDNLYLEWRNILDQPLSLRIGRQDFCYGNQRVMMDGNPGDGSRTLYYNAVKATWKGKKTTVDLFGIYNEDEDELALGTAERKLNRYSKALDDVTESGWGIYVTNTSIDDLIIDTYAIFKFEGSYDQKAVTNAGGYVKPSKAWQTLDTSAGTVGNPDLNLYTFGCRLVPKFRDNLTGNFEQAIQIGDRGNSDVMAWMVDWSLTYSLPLLTSIKPALEVGVYCLSGDDPGTDSDEGWNAIWARGTQQDLMLYAYDDYRWSNLMMPSVALTLAPSKKFKVLLGAYYLAAMEDDGPGEGKERGWRWLFKNEFTLAEKMLTKADKLTGHLQLELLEPGDYYQDNMDTAYFARWQLVYAF